MNKPKRFKPKILFLIQCGSSLLEVLISLFVLAVGVLGVLSMQVHAMKLNNQSYSLSRAVIFASNLAEEIKSNKQHALAYAIGEIPIQHSEDNSCEENTCTEAQLSQVTIKNWSFELNNSLPNGQASVDVLSNNLPDSLELLITIKFDSTTQYSDAPDSKWSHYSLVVGI